MNTSYTNLFLTLCVASLFVLPVGCGETSHPESHSSTTSGGGSSHPANPQKEPSDPNNPADPQNPGDPQNGPVEQTRPECKPEVYEHATVAGRLWLDSQRQGLTDFWQGVPDPADPSIPGIPDVEVTLHLKNGHVMKTTSCPNGWYSFQVDEPYGIIDYGRKDCTTNNCPTNLASKAGVAKIKQVTFGDSIASYPLKTAFAHPIWFPERFATYMEPIAEVENVNVAIPGTQTKDWLPESNNFKERLAPHADADVYVFTIGGNDVLYGLFSPKFFFNPRKLADDLAQRVDPALANIKKTIDALREQSPNADILLVSYFNYSRTFKSIKAIIGEENREYLRRSLTASLQRHIKELAGYKGLQIVDVYGASEARYAADTETDESKKYTNEVYLIGDGIHLNERGHAHHARELFKTYGGWIVGEEPEAQDPDDVKEWKKPLGTRRFVGYPTK